MADNNVPAQADQAPNQAAGERPNPLDTELTIAIHPRGYDQWCGIRAELEAERLIPKGFNWPDGDRRESWDAGGFNFWLSRVRPEGFKGPKMAWLALDNWVLRRVPLTSAHDGFAAARLYEKRTALEDELWSRTPAARQQWGKYCKARDDRAFQAFKSRVPALVPPVRGRRPKLAPPAA